MLMYALSTVGFLSRWFTTAQAFGFYSDRPYFLCDAYLGPQRWALNAVDFELTLVLSSLILVCRPRIPGGHVAEPLFTDMPSLR